ncbi:MAG TPA: glycosyltransferase family 87 protein [Candidatus Angelobacter sp.]|jgi:hypothetical protein|nr:glycosyltransferase family 87 protein [Candidatus Angelobacter sp.]
MSPSKRRLWSLAGPAALALAVAALLVQLVWALDAPVKTDYLPFATGARVLQSDPGCMYCQDVQASQQAAILGYTPTAGFPKPFVNPPLVAWALQPLSGLPLRTGLVALLAVLLAALAASLLLAERLLPRDWPDGKRIVVAAAGLISLPAATALGLAQWAPLLVLAALGALALLRRDRAVAAGVLLSVLLIKPQTVWLVLPALAAARSWRVLLGVAAGAGGWLATGLLLVGPSQMLQLPRLILERHVGEATRTAGLPGLVSDIFGSGGAAFVAAVAMGLLALAVLVRVRGVLRGRPAVAIALGVAASLAFAPHVFPDDLMLLAVCAVMWAPMAPAGAIAAMLAVSAAYQLDGWLPSPLAHLTPFALLGVLVGMALSLRARGAEGVPVATRTRLATGEARRATTAPS